MSSCYRGFRCRVGEISPSIGVIYGRLSIFPEMKQIQISSSNRTIKPLFSYNYTIGHWVCLLLLAFSPPFCLVSFIQCSNMRSTPTELLILAAGRAWRENFSKGKGKIYTSCAASEAKNRILLAKKRHCDARTSFNSSPF